MTRTRLTAAVAALLLALLSGCGGSSKGGGSTGKSASPEITIGTKNFPEQNALAVLPAYAKRWHLRTIADLAGVPGSVKIAAPPEFETRFEGLVGLRKVYGLTRLKLKQLRIGEQYGALNNHGADVANVFTT